MNHHRPVYGWHLAGPYCLFPRSQCYRNPTALAVVTALAHLQQSRRSQASLLSLRIQRRRQRRNHV